MPSWNTTPFSTFAQTPGGAPARRACSPPPSATTSRVGRCRSLRVQARSASSTCGYAGLRHEGAGRQRRPSRTSRTTSPSSVPAEPAEETEPAVEGVRGPEPVYIAEEPARAGACRPDGGRRARPAAGARRPTLRASPALHRDPPQRRWQGTPRRRSQDRRVAARGRSDRGERRSPRARPARPPAARRRHRRRGRGPRRRGARPRHPWLLRLQPASHPRRADRPLVEPHRRPHLRHRRRRRREPLRQRRALQGARGSARVGARVRARLPRPRRELQRQRRGHAAHLPRRRPADQVQPYVDVAREAGLRLRGIDLEALALLRAFVDPRRAASPATTVRPSSSRSVTRHRRSSSPAGARASSPGLRLGRFLARGRASQPSSERRPDEAAQILRHLSLTGPRQGAGRTRLRARGPRALEAARMRLTPSPASSSARSSSTSHSPTRWVSARS